MGKWISEGWEVFKKNAGISILYTFIVFACMWAISGIAKGNEFIDSALTIILAPPLMAGFFIMGIKSIRGEETSFATLFEGFKVWINLIILNLLQSIFVVVGLILLIIPGVYLSVGYAFSIPILIDKKTAILQALEMSRKTVHPIWFKMFGFFLLLGLINIGGLIAMAIGLLVTVPTCIYAISSAYIDIFTDQTGELNAKTE